MYKYLFHLLRGKRESFVKEYIQINSIEILTNTLKNVCL